MIPAEQEVLERLAALGIDYELRRHAPVFTVEESQRVRGASDPEVGHVKNLFLRDKKERMWLLTVPETRRVDIPSLRAVLASSGNPSFGSADRLRRYLGVEPGSVTPLAAIHDRDGCVRVLLDAEIRGWTSISVHPLHNAASVILSVGGLVRFLEDVAHAPSFVQVP
jgi:Ala-tRNA(Pro) deacylase